jgi:hypothetical protein
VRLRLLSGENGELLQSRGHRRLVVVQPEQGVNAHDGNVHPPVLLRRLAAAAAAAVAADAG